MWACKTEQRVWFLFLDFFFLEFVELIIILEDTCSCKISI